jgi:DNA-binding protein HU-beta
MNKATLLETLANKTHLTKKQVELILDNLQTTIIETIKTGGEVTLTGFGSFTARQRKARLGVDPRDPKKKIQMPSVKVVKFKAGKVLKEELKK